MKIIEPNVELWKQGDDKVAYIAKCARICYDKTEGNDAITYNGLLRRKHYSVFRHYSVYAKIPANHKVTTLWHNIFGHYTNCPYIDWLRIDNYYYIATNENFMIDIEHINPVMYEWISNNIVTETEFANNEFAFNNLMRYTFLVTTQISTSREINRVSPNNIIERSTRYVVENGCICRPHWLDKDMINVIEESNKYYVGPYDKYNDAVLYYKTCENTFITYDKLIKRNVLREDARGILPLDTATKVLYTYSIEEWRHIIDLRYYGTTGKPHPNAKIIAGFIKEQLEELGYNFK